MKILHVVNSLDSGGAERLVVDLAIEAQLRGDQVAILTLSSTEGIPKQDAALHEVPIFDLGLHRFNPSAITKIRRIATGFDVLNAHLFPSLYWATRAGIPSVYTEHSTSNRRAERKIWGVAEKYAYSGYDHIVTITQGVKSSLDTRLAALNVPTRSSVVVNGIRDEFFGVEKVIERSDSLRLVSVGSLRPVKNLELAIDAVSQTPKVKLDIIGEGSLHNSLQERIRVRGVSSRVRLLGPDYKLAHRLGNYDVLLSTSLREGFGLVAAEAMAAGLPVIGPDVPGFNEVVIQNETGLLFSRYKPEIVSSLISKFHDPSLRELLSRNARKQARNFTIANSYRGYREIYQYVIAESN